jgi:hypothetical protein
MTCRLQIDATCPLNVKGFKKLLAPNVDDGKPLPKDTRLNNFITHVCLYVPASKYRNLAKYLTTWVRIWREKCLEIAEQSWVFPPQMIVPSGTRSKETA